MGRKISAFIIISLVLMLVALTGCQGSTPASTTSDGNAVFGQVTAINGNSITIALFNMGNAGNGQQFQGNSGTSPSGGQRPQRSPGTMPSGGYGQYPRTSGGMGGPGSGNFGANLSGETKTFNVTDSTVITSGGMRQYSGSARASASPSSSPSASASPVTLSDIKVGSIISVTLSGDNAVSIIIMQMGNRNGNGGPSASGSPAPDDSSAPAASDTQPSPSPTPTPSTSTTPSVGAMVSF